MINEIAPGVFAIGVSDPDRRTFHGHEMSTRQGTTYNAYLVVDERETVLIDTVWPPLTDEFVENLCQVVDPGKITTIIVNHGEPDHAGALPMIKSLAPQAKIICSKRGLESLHGLYDPDWPLKVVETGDALVTGRMKLTFFMALMCHWPDSMMVHIGSAEAAASTGPDILVSSDVFGQHFTAAAFDDLADQHDLWFEAEKYFVNIITPYCRNVLNRLDELAKLNLPVKMFAPSHGVIWRRDVGAILAAYRKWANQETERRVVVVYDSMYEATRQMADAICDGLAAAGVRHSRHHLAVSDRSDVVTDLFGARGVLIGSPVWHMTVLPTVTGLQEDMKVLRFKGKLVGAFGSYGWQKNNVPLIEQRAREAGFEVPLPGLMVQWKPRPVDLENCRQFGRQFGELVKA